MEQFDGSHTFDELYDHRNLLFIAMCLERPGSCWIGKDNHYPGYFCIYKTIPNKNEGKLKFAQISYHIPDKYRYLVDNIIPVAENNYDGHSPQDCLDALVNYCMRGLL